MPIKIQYHAKKRGFFYQQFQKNYYSVPRHLEAKL
jgi:hypothetical protein